MPAILLKAKPVTDALDSSLVEKIKQFQKKKKRVPTLATVLVGEDPASQIYVGSKGKKCLELGLGHQDYKLSAKTSEKELLSLLKKLNGDKKIDGILVQKPLPKNISEWAVLDNLSFSKDVDGFTSTNFGLLAQNRDCLVPCTPAGIMALLKFYKIDVAGKKALVIGRSDIVGKPIGLLLLHANATVTYAHSRTTSMSDEVANADIIVSAIGKSAFLNSKFSFKKNAVIIDVGINRDSAGKVCGDADTESLISKVAAITPVPGGIGPMTIAMLMQNTVKAAYLREEMDYE